MGKSTFTRLESEDNKGRAEVIVPCTASLSTCTYSSSVATQQGKKRSTTSGISAVSRKRSLRKSSRWGSRFLRKLVHSAKENRRFSTGDGLESSQSVREMSQIQNGERFEGSQSTQSGRVDDISGPFGCVSTCTGTQGLPEVHANTCSRSDMAVSSNVFWPMHSSSYFHQAPSASGSLSERERHSDTPISGRLVSPSPILSAVTRSDTDCHRDPLSSWLVSQPQEVRTTANSTIGVSGHGHQPGYRHPASHQGEMSESTSLGGISSLCVEVDGQTIPFTFGATQPCGISNTSGTPPCSSSADVSCKFLFRDPIPVRHFSAPGESILSRSAVVGGSKPFENGSSFITTSTISDTLHGCQSGGVGSINSGRLCQRTVGSVRKEVAHFSVGASSCEVRASGAGDKSTTKDSQIDVGQCVRRGLFAQSRRDTLSPTLQGSSGSSSVVSVSSDGVAAHIHSREEKCNSGPVVSSTPSVANGMGAVPTCVWAATSRNSFIGSGLVCDSLECKVTSVCVPIPRSSGMGNRCPVDSMGGPDRICLSSHSDSGGSDRQDSQRRLSDSVDRSLLAQSTMVPTSSASTDRLSDSAPSEQTSVVPERPHLLQGTRPAKTSRVLAIEKKLVEEGFSQPVAARAASGAQKKSSLRLYESHFRTYVDWCNSRDIDHKSSNVQDLSDFLLFLHDSKGLSANTISNYRSSLARLIEPVGGLSASNHPAITDLLKSFLKDSPACRNRVPEWDLSRVLERLRSPPFEPPRWGTATEKLLCTTKTVFLLALASARRRGEIQAISRDKQDIVFDAKGVSLRTVAGFLPKTGIPGHDPSPFYIPALTPYSGNDSDDRFLCPVRMLNFYLLATGGTRDNERLFVKVKGSGPVSTQTVSAWIVRCIRMCYEHSVPARAHEVRRMATSWAYKGGMHSLEDIVVAGTWSNHTTFSSYYLADIRVQSDGKHRMVIAGKRCR